MTTANKITIGRILAIPVLVAALLYYADTGREGFRWLALISFAVAAVFDGVDGYVARRFNQRSELGALLDPMADKLLLTTALVLLTGANPNLQRIPLWLTILVLGRDIILTAGAVIVHQVCGKVRIRPHFVGKIATVFQMALVVWVMCKWPSEWLAWLVWGTALSTGISGAVYLTDGIRQLSASPISSPTPNQERK